MVASGFSLGAPGKKGLVLVGCTLYICTGFFFTFIFESVPGRTPSPKCETADCTTTPLRLIVICPFDPRPRNTSTDSRHERRFA